MRVTATPGRGAVPPPAAGIASERVRRAATPALLGALGAAMLAAAAWRIRASFGHMMWLDELYTATLIGAPSLGHLWDGAVRGVDGNPPLYMSLAYGLTSALPGAPEGVLRPLNLLCLAAAAALLYRIGRRLAGPLTAAAGLAVLPGLTGMPAFALLEVRTYALYLLAVTAVLFLALRVVDRPTAGRAAPLAAAGAVATLAHSFGGFYALAILGAAALARWIAGDRRAAAALAAAAVPTVLTLGGWLAVSLPHQTAMATPYGWIDRPGALALAMALTGSLALTPILASALLALGVAWTRDPRRAPLGADAAALLAALAACAALTVAGWVGSQLIEPFFVQRYFIPNLAVSALALVAVAEQLRRRVRPAVAGAAFLLCGLIGVWCLAQDGNGGPIPCRDAEGRFLERTAAPPGVPIVAESPDVWLTRERYAPGQAMIYPLDWQVVLDHPDRARNNAVDFHIMEILRGWAPPGSALARGILPTEEILARHGRFLVLDEVRRAWFDALRARRPVSATLLAEGPGCRLWEVRAPAAAEAAH